MSQTLPLREQLKALEQCQELDHKIDALKKQKAALPVALKTVEDAWTKAGATLTAKTKACEEIEKAMRQNSAALDLNKDRVTRANSKMEAVSNGQEYNAATKELEQLRKQAIQLEEQNKKAQAELDAARKEVTNLEGNLSKVAADRDAQKEAMAGQVAKLDQDIGHLLGERAKLTPGVDKRLLATYDRVRPARAGIGIVPATGGRCAGCNMVIAPQLFIEIQKMNEVHQCPSCHRVLFVPVSGK